jgi:hypothetical protein
MPAMAKNAGRSAAASLEFGLDHGHCTFCRRLFANSYTNMDPISSGSSIAPSLPPIIRRPEKVYYMESLHPVCFNLIGLHYYISGNINKYYRKMALRNVKTKIFLQIASRGQCVSIFTTKKREKTNIIVKS